MNLRTEGCWTALVTPLTDEGIVDMNALSLLVEYQKKYGINGLLAVGTTGESPTLDWDEHLNVIGKVKELSGSTPVMAGTGSNSTQESIRATKEAYDMGVDAALLVDPYYNAPSSTEIRNNYVVPISKNVPNIPLVLYVIPGRTGTMLHPVDIALLREECENVIAVKEATGNIDNMILTRELCGDDLMIVSGDDEITTEIMLNERIRACGAISVMSNIFPEAMSEMINCISEGRTDRALEIRENLSPMLGCVTVKSCESTRYGDVEVKFRNPVPVKTLMNTLGMPSGPTRAPLGSLTRNALGHLMAAARETYDNDPTLFSPIEDFFGVDVGERLNDPQYTDGLFHDSY